MKTNQPIGIFDSGVGGLSVLNELIKKFPNEHYIYYGDTLRLPYGEKSQNEIVYYTTCILNKFKQIKVKAVFVACNTSSALAVEKVKDKYDFPVFGVINPAAKYVSQLNCNKIGVIATSATAKSGVYSDLIKRYSKNKQVFEIGCPGLVEIVENNLVEQTETSAILKKFLKPLFENNVEKIILGCTHYPFLSSAFKKILKDENIFINPAQYQVIEAGEILSINKENFNLKIDFYVSSNPEKFEQIGQNLCNHCKNVQLADFIAISDSLKIPAENKA
ncbi:MAG: glutamate racemase [Candidatus Gastranaerophilales bacterium]|nr:glutamate racemase [Candidatus Gastranaerophilales bacterium]